MAADKPTTSVDDPGPSVANLETIVSLSKRRGFIFPSSEIYGGINAVWDYGQLGVELKNNVKRAWWRAMVQERNDIVGLDASIIMAPQVWVTSGHVANFTDPLVECQTCRRRYRLDELPGAEDLTNTELMDPAVVERLGLKCPADAGPLSAPRRFNLMFKTYMGPVEEEAAQVYLRPETAQGIYVNFRNVRETARKKLPFGIAQIGKSLPQRDHARQLHLPHARVRADGDGVLRCARQCQGVASVLDRRAHPVVRRPRHQQGQPAPLRALAGKAVALLRAHRGYRVPLPLPGQ